MCFMFFFFKQKTAYEIKECDWSSDVCSSDLALFLSYIRVGGQVLNLLSDVPSEMVLVIQSIIILLITAEAFLSQWQYRITIREAKKQEALDESAA